MHSRLSLGRPYKTIVTVRLCNVELQWIAQSNKRVEDLINEFTCTNLIWASLTRNYSFCFYFWFFSRCIVYVVLLLLTLSDTNWIPTQGKWFLPNQKRKLCDPKQSKSTETHYFTINFTLNFNFGGSYTLDSRFIMKNCVSLYLLNQNKKRKRTHGGVVFRMHDQTIWKMTIH